MHFAFEERNYGARERKIWHWLGQQVTLSSRARLAWRLHRVNRTKKLAPTTVGANRLRNAAILSIILFSAQSVFKVLLVNRIGVFFVNVTQNAEF